MGKALLLAVMAVLGAGSLGAQRVSRTGEYQGYSSPRFDGWQRTSQYLTMRDGVRLAVDIYRPTKNGVVHADRLPVLWSHVRYQRSFFRDDSLVPFFGMHGRGLELLVPYGYVIVAVDTRGGGASFGTQMGFFQREEARDAYEVTEWLAKQPWSTGKIGMVGRSYLGITQLFGASERPPHLKAIFPEMAGFEWYQFIYPGGVFRDDFFASWQKLTQQLDLSTPFTWFGRRIQGVTPVDGPAGPAQRDSAIAIHRQNRDILEMWSGVPFRNSIDPVTNKRIVTERAPGTYLASINRSGVAIYTQAGWYDAFTRDALQWFANLTVPRKLIIGPWFHNDNQKFDRETEIRRWFDFWLKGIDNGIMREPPLKFYVMGAPEGAEWRTSRTWPVAGVHPVSYFFSGKKSGSVDSKNDGSLSAERPERQAGADSAVVDTTATLGDATRWTATYGGKSGYPDLAPNDAKGWTYTTAPLPRDFEVIGHPVVHVWVTSSSHDVDLFGYLEDIDPAGRSTYVTEGVLRASHRKLGQPPFKNFGLPWHRSYQEDLAPLPDAPAELVFDLLPTAQRFRAGHRIRLTFTGADRDTHQKVYPTPPPMVAVVRDTQHPSRVTLPVVLVRPGH